MKGVGNFEAFLVAGLMILAILIVAFNVPLTGAVSDSETEPLFSIKNIDSAIHVGPKKILQKKIFSFNVDAENVQETRVAELGTQSTENGLLFGKKDIEYRITGKDPNSLFIGFEVTKTNELEPLIIKINDHVVHSAVLEQGQYGFLFNENLDKEMLITISAVSSSWRIWAPNLYELKDIKISVTDFADKQQSVPMVIEENELDTMQSARLDLNLVKAAGKLRITMNGEDIFSGIPLNAESIPLGKKHLQEENTLNFYALKNSDFEGTGIFVFSYLHKEEDRLETPINLTRLEFAEIREVIITFKTFAVARPGGLSIKIIHDNEVLFQDFAVVQGDELYEFLLEQNHFRKGFNTLVIESVDGATFSVADLDVSIR